ncbi:hypothetical protein ACSBR1_016461 [Camellia fascicularis]
MMSLKMFNMMSLKMLFMLAILMALAMTLSPTSAKKNYPSMMKKTFMMKTSHSSTYHTYDIPLHQSPEPISLRGTNRFLAQKLVRVNMTCDKYPRASRAKGSPGRDYCKKKCVDVRTDRLNCGKCGKKCKYSEICCKGACVNPRDNKKHCGSCDNKCDKGSLCVYGMCSYA